jgi:ferredoxin-NADP reductase
MYTITLKNREHLAGDIHAFIFEKPHGVTWRAGNHAIFFIEHENPDERGNSRPLSISSAPGDDHLMIISHCPAEGSSFKRALGALQPGATVQMTEPGGEFTLNDDIENPLFVAAGIGIGPVRAILRDREQRGVKLTADLQYYAPDGMFLFQQELQDFSGRHPELNIQFLAHDIAELGQIKEIEQRLDRKVYMSGVYVQRTEVDQSFDAAEDHVAAREEAQLVQAAKKLTGA